MILSSKKEPILTISASGDVGNSSDDARDIYYSGLMLMLHITRRYGLLVQPSKADAREGEGAMAMYCSLMVGKARSRWRW